MNYNLGKELKKIQANFEKNIKNFDPIKKNEKDLKVITYIGESTSALHMGLYGYPIITTPKLEKIKKEKNFIQFQNVYSTHTHSTPSLSDSLSLCTKEEELDCLGFNNLNNNLSVVDLLAKAGIETNLYSTQGSLGGHNIGSKLVLNTNNKFFSSDFESKDKGKRRLLGNNYIPKIKDKEFFFNYFCKNFSKNLNIKSSITFLHSYAGHGLYGGYLGFTSNTKKLEYPNYLNKNFLGKDYRNFELVKEYDTAIKYIDDTLSSVINCSLEKVIKKRTNIYLFRRPW